MVNGKNRTLYMSTVQSIEAATKPNLKKTLRGTYVSTYLLLLLLSISFHEMCFSVLPLVLFCVFLFHTAYVLYYCERGGVDLMGLKSNP